MLREKSTAATCSGPTVGNPVRIGPKSADIALAIYRKRCRSAERFPGCGMAQVHLKNRDFQHRYGVRKGHRGMAPTTGVQENKIRNRFLLNMEGNPTLNFFDQFPFVVGLEIRNPILGKLGLNLFNNLRHALITIDLRLANPQKVEVGAVQYHGMDIFHEPKVRR